MSLWKDFYQNKQYWKLFAGVYVCTFQPGNFTGQGSEGVKMRMVFDSSDEHEA